VRGAGRILVIDDDPGILELISDCLTREGYTVQTAPDAATALDRLWAAWDDQPDLILLDILLPALNGQTFAALYRALPVRQAAIVLMSALPYVEDVAPQIAASGALRKPFELKALLARVRQALAERADAADAADANRTPRAAGAGDPPPPGVPTVTG
jgi:DNA-binding response OmpR family regulator